MDAVGRISGWPGLPKYEAQIPRLQRDAGLWSTLAMILPFLAALLLGFGKEGAKKAGSSNQGSVLTSSGGFYEWTAGIGVYLLRVGISALGAVGFIIAAILVVSLLEKLGMRGR
jgi:hypothetical protein